MAPPTPEPRPSLLGRLFGWLFPRTRPTRSADAYFSAVAAGTADLPGEGPPIVLRPSWPGQPRSPLAAAYAARPAPAEPTAPLDSTPQPRWNVVEPADDADAVPHQEWVSELQPDGWCVLGASVRGKLHAHHGLWRDDAFAYARVGAWTCLAVADGAGSAPLSRVGARLACRAVGFLAEALDGWTLTPGEAPASAELTRLRDALVAALRQALAGISAEAERRQRALRDLHTTCLLAVHVPFGSAFLVGAVQVGDGCVALYQDDGLCVELGEADVGAYGGETRFLTTEDVSASLEGRVVFAVRSNLRAVALMSDGVADDFEAGGLAELFAGPARADCPRTLEGKALPGVLPGPAAEPRGGEALADWLRYEKRGSSDDRTLVLFHRLEPRP